ncbi:putative dehydrogenase [Thermosporothrix hazakensis]|jgi:predicted dehydrogenase|uniref:Putative dehydrogenase n=1 Tax=Thermosporothrix hazakensis TaxID=644383 RepID=A0A326U440_THEHA|nr:Gfo/Idh/MocA family oxidoreductase [Thermosporothrix hazakensis]PZW26591.1 putative dehydrogenase [Thermosporothrix hazakensis]GCE47706.1 oxidoreductase [Thermosporothrix hazakensis]
MPEYDRFRIGLIGYGIGKLHTAAIRSAGLYYPELPPVDLVAVATTSEKSGKAAVEQYGFQRYTTDYRELLNSDDINAVIIAPPHHLHREMLLAALQTDKAIYADKPLANNLAEAREIVAEARKRNRNGQICFNLRHSPAMAYAKKVIEAGRIGDIYAFRAVYYRPSYIDPEKPLRWKGSMKTSGGGVSNDLVPHIADLVLWLIGKPARLTAQARTFIKERPVAKGSAERTPIDTDDHIIIQAELPDGGIGTIESGRLITGSINDISIEIYGSEGSLRWSVTNPNYLYLAEKRMPSDERGWLAIPTFQNYPGAIVPGADIPVGEMRFYIDSMAQFIRKTVNHEPYDPDFVQGFHVQSVIEAALKASQTGTRVEVENE